MKILANGEIVADDDPRAQQIPNNASQRRPPRSNVSPTHPSPNSNPSSSSWSFGLGNPAADGGAGGGRGGIGTPTNNGGGRGGGRGGDQDPAVQVESMTVFDMINARMLEAGFPRLNIGPYAVEPIAVVGTCFALLLFGLPGLVLSLGLFLAVKFSQHGIPSVAQLSGGGAGAVGVGREERSQGLNGRRDLQEGRADEVGGSSGSGKTPEQEKWGPGQRLGGR